MNPTAAQTSRTHQSILDRSADLQTSHLNASQMEMDALLEDSTSFFVNRGNQSNLDFFCDRANKVASILSAVSILSTFIPALRPFSAAGIRILSAPKVSALLLATGSYALCQQAPSAKDALRRLFSSEYSHGRSRFENGVEVASFGLGLLGTFIGVGSFFYGGKSYLNWRTRFVQQGVIPSVAHDMALLRADAVRRAFHDPEVWMQFARQKPGLNLLQRNLIFQAGRWSNRFLLGGSALLGISHLALGEAELRRRKAAGEYIFISDYLGLGMQVLLEMGPGMSTLLYRGARGSHRYGMEAPMSQDLNEQAYNNPSLRVRVLERLRKAYAPLTHHDERAFVLQAERDLAKVQNMLEKAELHPPHVLEESGTNFIQEANVAEVLQARTKGKLQLVMQDYSEFNLGDFLEAFQKNLFSPEHLLDEILNHPAVENGSLFPRDLKTGSLGRILRGLARESSRRFREGQARPLEGIPIAVKDLFPGVDGVMQVGSKTARLTVEGKSPVVDVLLEMGAIPIPVGMVASANGGSGDHAGFGYIPHPNRAEFDPAGSSSATAHVVGLKNLPIQIGIGTDTGGSVIAPAGAVGIFGFVPPRALISTKNMVPFASFLDRVGILSLHPQDGMDLAYALTRRIGDDPHMVRANPGKMFAPSREIPRIYFLMDVFRHSSRTAQESFIQKMQEMHAKGYQVRALNSDWNFLADIPMLLYPFDAYPAAAFTHMNPLRNNFYDPPRMSLDHNLYIRMPKAALSLEHGYYDKARDFSHRYAAVVSKLFPEGSVLASPSTEAILGQDILQGRAGNALDGHDRITMPKNRIDGWGQMSIPAHPHAEVGLAFSGQLASLMRILQDTHTIH